MLICLISISNERLAGQVATTCSSPDCNLVCFGDFESFVPQANTYHSQLGVNDFYISGSPNNFPDIINDVTGGSKALRWGRVVQIVANVFEAAHIPLSEPIPAGCTVNITYRATAAASSPALPDPKISIWGLAGAPCGVIQEPDCALQSTPLCFFPANNAFRLDCRTIPVDPGVSFGIDVTGLDFVTYTVSVANNSGAPITDLLLYGESTFSGSHFYFFFVDDVEVKTDCFCSDPEPFTCSCTDANTLNIAASAEGTHYSAMEALFDYDKNDDGVLDQTDHNGCVAISGRLIVDEDLTITGCTNLLMQPCTEVVVQGNKHLTMTYNTISGCQSMWRYVRVEPEGYLTFRDNVVSDAQHTIWAEPGTAFSSGPQTRLDIQNNRFERNHIGLYIPGSGSGYFGGGGIWQTPFTGNNMLCKGTGNTLGDLLPPCDASLTNYDPEYGYAGVVALGTNFNVGVAGGQVNTFSNLRNGVLAERGFLNVDRSNFNNMIGYADFLPTTSFSQGVGVLGNNGFFNVRNANFIDAGHAVTNISSVFSLRNSNTERVRIGVESWQPLDLNIQDNPSVGFLNFGVRAWELSTFSWFTSHLIDNNQFYLQDMKVANTGEWNMQLSNTIPANLLPGFGTISRNEMYVGDQAGGLFIANLGAWTISNNHVEYSANPQNIIISEGFSLNNSDNNYLYANSVLDVTGSALSGTTGFNIAASAGNRFCCNATEGNSFGSVFSGACLGTSYRQTDMADHDYAFWLQGKTVIGQQPSQQNGPATNNNRFGASSGVALHDGTDFILAQSTFFVTNPNTPHYPQTVSTPNGVPSVWFQTNGAFPYLCLSDEFCISEVNPGGERNTVEFTDIGIATYQFDTIAGGAALQWEGELDLFARLKAYPGMLGQAAAVDAFYAAKDSGSVVKDFYEAELLAAAVNSAPETWIEDISSALDSIVTIEAESEAVLSLLPSQPTREDSLSVYWQSQQVRDRLAPFVAQFVQKQHEIDSLRQVNAAIALSAVTALSATNVLQSNRKEALRVALELISADSSRLSAAQFAIVSAIAHQCPLDGGSAVFIARSLYLLNEQKRFDDLDLCGLEAGERALPETQPAASDILSVWPNPATDAATVFVPGLNHEESVYVRIFDLSGRVVREDTDVSVVAGVFSLDLSRMTTGVYFCQVATREHFFAPVKFTVSR